MFWSFFTGRWGAARTTNDSQNDQAEKFSAEPSAHPREDNQLHRQYSCSSPDFGRRLRAAAEEWKAKERAVQSSPTKANQEHVSVAETLSSSESDIGSQDCLIAHSSLNANVPTFSQDRLPSPYVAHDYSRWSNDDWALLYKFRQDLYYYHYQLHVHALGWGSDEWDAFRSTYPEQMTTLEAYNSNWEIHGTPDQPLPEIGEPLIEGGYATEEWLSSMNPLSGSLTTESQWRCGENLSGSESTACNNEEAGASDAVASGDSQDVSVPPDHANAPSVSLSEAAASSLPDEAAGTNACPTGGLCSGKSEPVGRSITQLKDTRQIVSLNARESSSCLSCDGYGDEDEDESAQEGTGVRHGSPLSCGGAAKATACVANAAQPADGEFPAAAVDALPGLVSCSDEPAEGVDDPFLALDGGFAITQAPGAQMVPCQARDGGAVAELQCAETQTDTSSIPQCAQTQTDESIDGLNEVAADAEAPAAREQSLLRALEEAQADAAVLRAQLQDCRSAFAETEAHSREISERLSATEAGLGTAKQQLAEAAERESALASRAKAQDLELAAFRACGADLREDNARLRAEVATLKRERKPTQESAEAPVTSEVAQPSQPAGTDATAVTRTGETAARTGAQPAEGMPFSVSVKMAQLCIAGDPLFREGLLTSPTLKMSSRHADLLERWTSPRPPAQPLQRAATTGLPEPCPSAGGHVDRALGSLPASGWQENCSHTADDMARADAAKDAAETRALAGHPSLTLRVTGEHGCGLGELEKDGCGSLEAASATGSPSPSNLFSPAKGPHTPHQTKLGAASMTCSRA